MNAAMTLVETLKALEAYCLSVGEKVRIAGMGGTWTVKRIEPSGVVCECECSRQHTQKFAFTRIRRPMEDGQ